MIVTGDYFELAPAQVHIFARDMTYTVECRFKTVVFFRVWLGFLPNDQYNITE